MPLIAPLHNRSLCALSSAEFAGSLKPTPLRKLFQGFAGFSPLISSTSLGPSLSGFLRSVIPIKMKSPKKEVSPSHLTHLEADLTCGLVVTDPQEVSELHAGGLLEFTSGGVLVT